MAMVKSANKALLAIFGGTFDPVHNGHLSALSDLQALLNFDQVRWVLSARPPHKDQVTADINQRFEMLEIALAAHKDFVADDIEIRRQAKSYTIDTVFELQAAHPDARVCLIIGSDSLLKLESWHRYEELKELVHFIVMARPGYRIEVPESLSDRLTDSVESLRQSDSPAIYIYEQSDYLISSTEIRHLLATADQEEHHKLLSNMLPEAVFDYIKRHQSYRMRAMNSEQIKDQVVDSLESVKGQDIRVIDIAEISDFADYMVVASGTSDTHVKALARETSNNLRSQGVKPLNEDGADLGEWVLVDFGDVVLHVMRPEVRAYYDLEKLWDEDVRELVKQHREQQDDAQ